MATEQFANLAASTLTAGISAVATTLTVVSATPFSTAPQFRIIIDSEIMLVTGVAGAVFTVTRASEGTTATTHATSAVVTQIVTAAAMNLLVQSGSYPTIGTPVHRYKCNEATGSGTTLTDSGSGLNNATLSGAEGTDWSLGSNGLYTKNPALYMYSTTTSTKAQATIADVPSSSDLTLLCTVRILAQVVDETIFTLDAATSTDDFYLAVDQVSPGAPGTPIFYAGMKIANTETRTGTTSGTSFFAARGTLYTIAAIWHDNVNLEMWVNGYKVASAARVAHNVAFTRLVLGNFRSNSLASAYQGWIGDACVYTSALTQANLLAYDEAARRL